jgi:hypothetical protein
MPRISPVIARYAALTMELDLTCCVDLKDKPGFPGCCHSCHDDAEAGFGYLMERYVGDYQNERLTHRLCCRVNEWLPMEDGNAD